MSEQTQFFILSFSDFGIIKHLLDRASPNIRFVVQIEADVGLSFASSNISIDLHDKSNVRLGAVQQVYNISTCKHHKTQPLKVWSDSLSQVRFPTCQFYLSIFDVTRLSNFHEVLKTSVKCVQPKTDIPGTAIEMLLLLF